MDTVASIKIPRTAGNKKEWFLLAGSEAYKNVGMNAEVGYTSTGSEPTVLKGEAVLQGEIIDTSRGDIYILQDACFSYEFMKTEKEDATAKVISSSSTKTVGIGKDFETLHLALRWLETVTCVGRGYVYLVLDDGIHLIGGENELDEAEWAYYTFSFAKIGIKSASGNKDNCIISQDPYDDGDNWASLFSAYGSYVWFDKVTFDTSAGGYPYPNSTVLIWGYLGTTIYSSRCVFKNMNTVLYSTSIVTEYYSTFSDCGTAIETAKGKADGTNISQCAIGIKTDTGYQPSHIKLKDVVFDNNTSDTNIPLNEIQYDGSYITDDINPLTLKA